MPTYHPGNRVLLRIVWGEFPTTVAAVDHVAPGEPLYLIEPDADSGASFPRIIAIDSHLRPHDDADTPLMVGG